MYVKDRPLNMSSLGEGGVRGRSYQSLLLSAQRSRGEGEVWSGDFLDDLINGRFLRGWLSINYVVDLIARPSPPFHRPSSK